MKRTYLIIGIAVLAVLAVAGYFTYEYLKQKPPSWLTTLVASPDKAPPLPAGDAAPFDVPEGFAATIFSRETPGGRVMALDQGGTLLVSSTKGGTVVALPDKDGDGLADRTVTVLEGLRQPHGILVSCEMDRPCMLYVAETDTLASYEYDSDTYAASNRTELASFPAGDGHYTRSLLMHPDGDSLLISIGSSCNVCDEQNPLRASVQRYDLASGQMTAYATGLRNTVFMALNPVDGSVWGTDNGRDMIGDDIPPDEINVIEEGRDYGWPVCYGQNVPDTDFSSKKGSTCPSSVPAEIDLAAHAAALGIAFIPEEGWPEDMWHDLIVAYHGSWNRSEPAGYKVVRVDMDRNGTYQGGAISDFMTGFLPEGWDTDDALGRPAGVLAMPGGVLYISDDHAGAVYRITRTESSY